MVKSPSHTFATTGPEPLSTTDSTPYAAICVISRKEPTQNAGVIRVGGNDITATEGGKDLGAPGDAFWFGPAPGLSWKLTELFGAGSVGDVVDTICKQWG